tara:strand:- start:61 stop:567 length:507 start_codon:yes stop_codon:yes gene_type:complete
MNLSNLYNYSILTGVWNDLDYDVLLMVKEYLRVHLDRRLLNKDYNVFLESIKDKIKNTPSYFRCPENQILLTRQGLLSDKRSGWIISFKRKIYKRRICIDDFIFPKYYISSIVICLRNSGFTDTERIYFLNKYKKNKSDIDFYTISDNITIKQTIRMIMDDEELLIQS